MKQSALPSFSNVLRFLVRQLIPNIGTILVVMLLLFTYNARASSSPATNGPASPNVTPGVLPYQGLLSDRNGQALTGKVDMIFRIYNAPTGGTALWLEAHSGLANGVQVTNGVFNVLLGSLTPISTSVWNNPALYLGAQVGSDSEMSPREGMSAVPYAMQAAIAGVADGSITTAKIADGNISRSKLDFRVPRLLGYKNCQNCADVTEMMGLGWNPVKGADTQDIIQTIVATDGGPVLVQAAMRRVTAVPVMSFCHISIFKDGVLVQGAHIAGQSLPTTDWACSGSYLFPNLPAGTYTFRIFVWSNEVTTATWVHERQIVVYQY